MLGYGAMDERSGDDGIVVVMFFVVYLLFGAGFFLETFSGIRPMSLRAYSSAAWPVLLIYKAGEAVSHALEESQRQECAGEIPDA